MKSRFPSWLLLLLTLFVGGQLAVAQVHCEAPPLGDDHDCALCHTGKLQSVDTLAATVGIADPSPDDVPVAETPAVLAAPVLARQGRAPPSRS